MRKLLLITGDLEAGKSTFSEILFKRYGIVAFQKEAVKEVLGDSIEFQNREENKRLSDEAELKKLHAIANENQYDVLTLVLRGMLKFCILLNQIDTFMEWQSGI